MKQLTNVLIWSVVAGLVSAAVYFVLNETGNEPSFVSGGAIGGILAGTGTYLKRQRRAGRT